MTRYLLPLCCAALVYAQGTEPKAKAEDYEVHGLAGGVAIGAEYMVHSFSGDGQTFLAPNYLVVEAALFPPKGGSVTVGAFQLRVDGRRTLPAATAQMVTDSLRRPYADRTRGVDVAGSAGPVIFGSPQPPPYGYPRRTPAPPRAPDPDYGSGLPPKEAVKADELVVKTAMPGGEFAGPVSGFLYFRFEGKASKIRSVDLLYEGTTLKLK